MIQKRIDEWMKNEKEKDNENIADFSKVLLLPNQEFPSDHLPVSAVFEFDDLCTKLNKQNKTCLVCDEQVKKVGKTKNNQKKRPKLKNKQEWVFHEMCSF